MKRSDIGANVASYVAFLLVVLGLVSWVTGEPFLIPSLGPSAFLLATLPDEEMNYPRRIVGAEVIAAFSGFAAFHAVVGGDVAVTSAQPLSLVALRQVLSTFFAATLTTVGTYATGFQHPPAYATTLIVSLGILTSPRGIGFFMVALLVMVGLHETVGKRFPLWNLPYQRENR